jgi:hypothetical protein
LNELFGPVKHELAGGRKHASAEECSGEDLKDELHAALGELFQRTKHKIASIRKYARAEDRRILIREFRAEMRVAKRDRLLAFRQASQPLRLRKTLLVQARSSAATPPRALGSALKNLKLS